MIVDTAGVALAAASTSTGEAVAFWLLAPVAVAAALMLVLSRKAVHSALWMALTMVILAVFFLLQGGVFLGVVQIVVYTGAVMMLFLFVVMLVGVDASDSFVETLRGQRVLAGLVGIGFAGLVIGALTRATLPDFVGVEEANEAAGGHVEALAELMFTRHVLSLEVLSALLITAAVGALVLTHRERLVPRPSQRQLAEARIREGTHPTPLPSSGVFAGHNAVDTPALLPDGSPAEASVPQQLRRRGTVRPSGPVELPPPDEGDDR